MSQRVKISNCVNGTLNDGKESHLKQIFLEIANELKHSYE